MPGAGVSIQPNGSDAILTTSIALDGESDVPMRSYEKACRGEPGGLIQIRSSGAEVRTFAHRTAARLKKSPPG